MKILKFRRKLSKLILSDEKSTTWRLFDDKDLSVGDEVSFVVWEDGREFARVKIINVKETSFDVLTDDDWTGHEKFVSDNVMYKTFEKYYNRSVNKNSPVKIIKFEIL